MIYRLLLIFILFPIIVTSQVKYEDNIKYWDATDTLVYSDFNKRVTTVKLDDSDLHEYGKIFYAWKYQYDNDSNLISIQNVMYKDSSHIILNESKYYTLKHESAHFHISEIFLRKALNEISRINLDTSFNTFANYPNFYNDIYNKIKEVYDYYFDLEKQAQDSFHTVVYGKEELEPIECKRYKKILSENFNSYNDCSDFFRTLTNFKNKIDTYILLYNEHVKLHNNNLMSKAQIKLKEAEKYKKEAIVKLEEMVILFPDIEENIDNYEIIGDYYKKNKNYINAEKNYKNSMRLLEEKINDSSLYDEKLNVLYEHIICVYDALNDSDSAQETRIKRNIRNNTK